MTILSTVALTGFFVWAGIGGITTPSMTYAKDLTEPAIEILSVKLTGYNAVPEQTDSDPHVTSSGARSNPEVVAARSRDLSEVLPFGTVIALLAPGKENHSCGFKAVEHLLGYRVIADVTHARKEKQIDILYDDAKSVSVGGKATNPAIAAGVCEVTIRVVGKISVKEIPATQAELAIMVNKELAFK